ncbi:MAG TPA: hypothetical protein PLP19_15130, partial [bacterium]|nr:hypothetical protein [bacterium]HPN44824.1 hypothetical protein [bacterium]
DSHLFLFFAIDKYSNLHFLQHYFHFHTVSPARPHTSYQASRLGTQVDSLPLRHGEKELCTFSTIPAEPDYQDSGPETRNQV